jgi:hypothetical protein
MPFVIAFCNFHHFLGGSFFCHFSFVFDAVHVCFRRSHGLNLSSPQTEIPY